LKQRVVNLAGHARALFHHRVVSRRNFANSCAADRALGALSLRDVLHRAGVGEVAGLVNTWAGQALNVLDPAIARDQAMIEINRRGVAR
jgi:hypothetical protein